jgi:NDP-sugar pyrophosphorylase family protein
MKFAILAAGEGSRLASEGVAKPKPLVELQGIPLIERLIRIFARNGASCINIIVNEQQPETVGFIKSLEVGCPINIVIKSTPSSMHSMHALSHLLRGEKFCLTTVDTLFHEDEFARYIKTFEEYDGDGIMAVTDYIDDEKPLYIATDEKMQITAFCDTPTAETHFISGGIYALSPKALDVLDQCMNDGVHRMRNFQRRLVESGMKLKAFPLGKIIDIDHAEDIEKAERFISRV